MTLTEFLLARIAEDEAGPFFNAWHVGRVRAECEAKRRIVEDLRPALPFVRGDGGTVGHHFILRHLASVYASHPDYRAEWKP